MWSFDPRNALSSLSLTSGMESSSLEPAWGSQRLRSSDIWEIDEIAGAPSISNTKNIDILIR